MNADEEVEVSHLLFQYPMSRVVYSQGTYGFCSHCQRWVTQRQTVWMTREEAMGLVR